MNKLEDVLRRAETNELTDDDCATIRTLFVSYVHLLDLLKNKKTSIDRLRKLLFGANTEKLAAVGERARQAALEEDGSAESADDSPEDVKTERTGMFTTGIVSIRGDQKIALFLSGRQHAGENLKDVLLRRTSELPPPIQMCDALSRNVPGELQTILGNCLTDGRRQFVDVTACFPEECRHVLESLAAVYHNDALARERNMSPRQRLEFHQRESGPTMENPFDYLTELKRHAGELRAAPQNWTPWNYRQTLDSPAAVPTAAP